MIRRYYILPLRPGVADADVRAFIDVLCAADRRIPGLRDSSAGIDAESRTVVWENTFVDEATYAGPYMVHPYHIGAIDSFVMADSPRCLTQDIYTTRHQLDDATQQLRSGIRRIVLVNVGTDADADAIGRLASQAQPMASSRFGPDDVGWVSAKGRTWTHVWEQGFTDKTQLDTYLRTRDGLACSSLEGFARLGIEVRSLKILACPFALTPEDEQTPGPAPDNDAPVLHTITARVAPPDVDRYLDLLERHYDPFMEAGGAPLRHRWVTADQSADETEVQSTWQLASLAAYSDLRASTYRHPDWDAFIRDAMPLVRGGSRRFHYACEVPAG